HEARAAVLLVSPDFLVSEKTRNSELPVLLRRARDNGVVIIPIIVRQCLFQDIRFKYSNPETGREEEFSLATFPPANPPDRPLNAMTASEQDAVLLSVAQRLARLVHAEDPPPRLSKWTLIGLAGVAAIALFAAVFAPPSASQVTRETVA